MTINTGTTISKLEQPRRWKIKTQSRRSTFISFERITQAGTNQYTIPAWLPWIVKRIVSSLLGIIVISMLVFAATQALPSDPARVILGPEATEDAVEVFRKHLGMDQPITTQYVKWISRALQGDWGHSIDSNIPVTQLIAGRLENSLALVASVLIVIIPGSLFLGVFLALRRDSWIDRTCVSAMIALKAIPSFAIAIGLMMLLATSVFPVLPAVSLLDPNQSAFAQPIFMILPALTLVIATLPYLTRLVRGSMIEVLDSEFITSARLRGLKHRTIIWQYAIPNAVIPAIQAIALTTSVMIGGVLIVEVVFTYPGIGSALNSAVDIRDIPVIQAIVVFLAGSVMLINLLADIATVMLTPRLRTQPASTGA
ncbi:ABC transporter permease [Methylobacillus flagellatus]|uniref:ABC transporter permease n=1 Tax=Methylobacillus flagellatus TaxID=405 RepID=UPI002853A8CA|nr:ABC transporter permease [Methylobacillus flagellatus]MDR5172707.1 ABC transporter permease [Methylobacillus flagellatus]